MRINHTRDSAIKTIILGMLVATVFVVIACSNSEEVTGPVTTTDTGALLASKDANALHDANGNQWIVADGAPESKDGDFWFIDENDDKALMEFSDDATWTSREELTTQLHELIGEYKTNPAGMSQDDMDKMQGMKVHLHTMMSQDDMVFGGNGDARGHFIDDNGNKTVVEFKDGSWQAEGMGEMDLKELKKLHEEKVKPSDE